MKGKIWVDRGRQDLHFKPTTLYVLTISVYAGLAMFLESYMLWPGGWFADEYHWMDGIGPKEKRKSKTYVNANVGSGTVPRCSVVSLRLKRQ